ncbi:MAG: hypothetical protein HDT33_07185 [Clostridiales bacterium]|nr:hypothetical protein [Clostridiales bacterium]
MVPFIWHHFAVKLSQGPQHTVSSWINSPGHFQTIIDPNCTTSAWASPSTTCCYLVLEILNSVNFYAQQGTARMSKSEDQFSLRFRRA